MFKVNFRLSLRSLQKNKLYTFINVSGLAVGVATAILICLWIQNEVSHDRFHPDIDRLYLMNNRDKNNGGVYVWNNTCRPLGPTIQKDYPEKELRADKERIVVHRGGDGCSTNKRAYD